MYFKIQFLYYFSVILSLVCVCSSLRIMKKPLTQCNDFNKGYYSINSKLNSVNCTTACNLYLEKKGNHSSLVGKCNDQLCQGDMFVIKQNYSFQYTCCDTDLCNNENLAFSSLNYKCEFGRKLTKSKKLIFPIETQKSAKVTKCFHCNRCNSSQIPKITNCAAKNKKSKSFFCQVFINFHLCIINSV